MSLSPYYYKVDDSCPKLPNLRQLFDLFEEDTYYIYSFPLKRAKYDSTLMKSGNLSEIIGAGERRDPLKNS